MLNSVYSPLVFEKKKKKEGRKKQRKSKERKNERRKVVNLYHALLSL